MPNVLPEGMNHEEVRLLRQQAQKTAAHPIRTNEPPFSLFLFGSVRSVFPVFPRRLRSDPRTVLFKGWLGEERPEQHQHRRHIICGKIHWLQTYMAWPDSVDFLYDIAAFLDP